MAVVTASRKPASVLGVKYTTMFAAGAIDPTTSMSSMTSPSGPFAAPVGEFVPWSTDTAETLGEPTLSPVKYVFRSAGRNPPPISMMATHCPSPVPLGKPYKDATCVGVYDTGAVAPARFFARLSVGRVLKCGLACGRLSRPS